MSPVGQTLAYILADAGGATLTAADQQEYRALSVENLTRRVLAWPLPLARLQHWINGEAAPDQATATVARDAQGREAALEGRLEHPLYIPGIGGRGAAAAPP